MAREVEVVYADTVSRNKEICDIKGCKKEAMLFLVEDEAFLCYDHFLELKKKK